jgi:uncharacterized protein YjbJ (UPF0337 family)
MAGEQDQLEGKAEEWAGKAEGDVKEEAEGKGKQELGNLEKEGEEKAQGLEEDVKNKL